MTGERAPVLYLVRSWPRLTQTFVLNEVLAVERRGVDVVLVSLSHSDDAVVQPEVADVRAPVTFLDDPRRLRCRLRDHVRALAAAPARYASAVAFVARRRDLDTGYRNATRWWCLGAAVHVAAIARDAGVGHVHAHFAHDPTLVAQLVRRLTGIPFSFTAHARDLYQIPERSLVERAADATAVVTCCGINLEHLQATLAPTDRVKAHLVHHGIGLDEFVPGDARPDADVPLVLSVGRLVEKKGFGDLLAALAKVASDGHRFRCEIHGDGPDEAVLQRQIDALGLGDRVELRGARPRRELLEVFQRADVFALTPFVTDDGDRDGIPNVLLEAMACGVPVVATGAGGIPELVVDGVNGALVESHDLDGIAGAIGALLADPARRRALGEAGRRTVVEGYDIARAAATLTGLFEGAA